MNGPEKILNYLCKLHPGKCFCDECLEIELDLHVPMEAIMNYLGTLPMIRRQVAECTLCREPKLASAMGPKSRRPPPPDVLH